MSTKTSSAGRRRFWIVVACFAIANAAVWLMYDRIERWRPALQALCTEQTIERAIVIGSVIFYLRIHHLRPRLIPERFQ